MKEEVKEEAKEEAKVEVIGEAEERPVEKLSRFVDSITTYFESMPDPVFLPYYYGANLRYAVLVYDFKTKHILRYSTPGIDWQSYWYTFMGKGTLFGVADNSCEAYKLTVKKMNMANIEFTKERFDYNGSARHQTELINVNDRYAYLIGG